MNSWQKGEDEIIINWQKEAQVILKEEKLDLSA